MTSSNRFFRFLCHVWALLPRPLIRWLGAGFGILWFDIFRLRRKVVLDNLKIAFPEKDDAWRTKIGRTSLCRFGANLFEFFTLPSLSESWIRKNAVIHGLERMEAAHQKGKGVFLLGIHMGSYDIAGSLLPMRGYDTVLISKFMKAKWLNDIWFGIRGAKGMKFIEPHGDKTAFDILRVIKRKGAVIFVTDQFMGRPFAIETEFFGRKTGTAYGLALFVLKTGSPVVPVYSVEGKDAKMHLIFDPEVDVSGLIDDDKDASIRRLTQKFNETLEGIIRKYPEEWLWIHRRWKEYE